MFSTREQPPPGPARLRSRPGPAACRSSTTGAARRSGRRGARAARAGGPCPGSLVRPMWGVRSRGCRSGASQRRPRAARPPALDRVEQLAEQPIGGSHQDGFSCVRSRTIAASRSSPRRSGPAPIRPSMMPSVNRRIDHCSGSAISTVPTGPRPARSPGRPVLRSDGGSSPFRSAAGADGRRGSPSARRRDASISSSQSVANNRGRWRSCSNTRHSVSRTVSCEAPASFRPRQVALRLTPIAASSAPWPQTSPISACSRPSPPSTRSKKSPPSSARRRPGRLHETDQMPPSATSGLGASPRSRRSTSRACASASSSSRSASSLARRPPRSGSRDRAVRARAAP